MIGSLGEREVDQLPDALLTGRDALRCDQSMSSYYEGLYVLDPDSRIAGTADGASRGLLRGGQAGGAFLWWRPQSQWSRVGWTDDPQNQAGWVVTDEPPRLAPDATGILKDRLLPPSQQPDAVREALYHLAAEHGSNGAQTETLRSGLWWTGCGEHIYGMVECAWHSPEWVAPRSTPRQPAPGTHPSIADAARTHNTHPAAAVQPPGSSDAAPVPTLSRSEQQWQAHAAAARSAPAAAQTADAHSHGLSSLLVLAAIGLAAMGAVGVALTYGDLQRIVLQRCPAALLDSAVVARARHLRLHARQVGWRLALTRSGAAVAGSEYESVCAHGLETPEPLEMDPTGDAELLADGGAELLVDGGAELIRAPAPEAIGDDDDAHGLRDADGRVVAV